MPSSIAKWPRTCRRSRSRGRSPTACTARSRPASSRGAPSSGRWPRMQRRAARGWWAVATSCRSIARVGVNESVNGGKAFAQLYAALALRHFGADLQQNAIWQSLSDQRSRRVDAAARSDAVLRSRDAPRDRPARELPRRRLAHGDPVASRWACSRIARSSTR